MNTFFFSVKRFPHLFWVIATTSLILAFSTVGRELKQNFSNISLQCAEYSLAYNYFDFAKSFYYFALGINPQNNRQSQFAIKLSDFLLEDKEFTKASAIILVSYEALSSEAKKNDAVLLNHLSKIATFQKNEKNYSEAENSFKTIFNSRSKYLGESNVDTLKALNNLGQFYEETDRLSEAEAIISSVIKMESNNSPHSKNLGLYLNNLGSIYSKQSRFEEAESTLLKSFHQIKLAYGENSVSMALLLNNLGVLYERWGRPNDAKNKYERALSIAQNFFSPNDRNLLTIRKNLNKLQNAS